jgi:hypothetical protein
MLYEGESEGYTTVKCERCGEINKIHKTHCKQYGNEYHFNPPIPCSCGIKEAVAYKRQQSFVKNNNSEDELVRCP